MDPWGFVIARLADQAYRSQHRRGVQIDGVEVERCDFDNCGISDARIVNLVAGNNRCWACHFNNVVLEDSVVDGLGATLGSGGRTAPISIFGGRFKHVVLRGRVGSLLLNRPYEWRRGKPWPRAALDDYRRYYADVDWALDISEAAFTSVPALRFGPPAHLIRIKPQHQVVVTREAASSESWRSLDIGVWGILLEDLLEQPWPDTMVLAAATAGRQLAEELRGLAILRDAGIGT